MLTWAYFIDGPKQGDSTQVEAFRPVVEVAILPPCAVKWPPDFAKPLDRVEFTVVRYHLQFPVHGRSGVYSITPQRPDASDMKRLAYEIGRELERRKREGKP